MGGGEKETEEGGNTSGAESSISGANFDKIRAAAPARFDARYRFPRRVVSVSVFGLYRAAINIPFSLKYADYTTKARRKTIKKVFGRLIDFVF